MKIRLLVEWLTPFLVLNMFKDDGSVIHFTNPKVQATIGANTFSVTLGHSETKPEIYSILLILQLQTLIDLYE